MMISLKPMMMVAAFSSDSEQGQAMIAQMGLPEGTDPMAALAQMPEEAVQQIMSQVDEKLKDMPESIVTQAGVSFVASEYEALGHRCGFHSDALYSDVRSENACHGTCDHACGHQRNFYFCQSSRSVLVMI